MNQLREPLEHLRTELDEANARESHPLLGDLQHDTGRTLERDDHREALASDPSFRARLEQVVEHFEASHPNLTRAAMRVLDVLTANGL